jgi:hypothetical protein
VGSRRTIHVGLNLSPTEDLRVAALPLLEASEVDVLELSVDLAFAPVPEWADALLEFFGYEGRLVGHGVEMSAFTAGQDDRRRLWLSRLDEVQRRYRLTHLSEHFGFMTGGDFVGGTPFPVPYTRAALAVAHDNLMELKSHLGEMPIGLENLALALSNRDVDEQPDFLEALLSPIDGFVHLDLHNLYCQAENYARDPSELLRRYPLSRVVKIHLAGGNYFVDGRERFRRDDHERDVPEACLALLEEALGLCPRLEHVILEHADHALKDVEGVEAFRSTYRRIREIVRSATAEPVAPAAPEWREPDPSGDDIAPLQAALLECLDGSADRAEARSRLAGDERLAPFRGWVESFDDRALGLARLLVDRWGERPEVAADGAMRTAVLEAPAVLRFRDAPIPIPGPGQVRLRVEAAGVCGTDVHLFRGLFGFSRPLVLGHEAVGRVDAVGPSVVAPKLGQRVGVPWAQKSCGQCPECQLGKQRSCRALTTWIDNGGFFAHYAIVEAAACVVVPDALDPILAAPLFCAGHTAFAALEAGGAGPGMRVAVVGIGGLGHLAVQLAAQRGCEVFALTRDPTKVHELARLGAHTVLVGRDPVTELEDAGGVDLIVSTTSDPSAAGRLVPALRAEGCLAIAGLGETPLSVDAAELVQRGASIVSVVPGGKDQLASVVALASAGRVAPIVEVYGFGQLRRVFYRLADSRVRYRAVIDLAGPLR